MYERNPRTSPVRAPGPGEVLLARKHVDLIEMALRNQILVINTRVDAALDAEPGGGPEADSPGILIRQRKKYWGWVKEIQAARRSDWTQPIRYGAEEFAEIVEVCDDHRNRYTPGELVPLFDEFLDAFDRAGEADPRNPPRVVRVTDPPAREDHAPHAYRDRLN